MSPPRKYTAVVADNGMLRYGAVIHLIPTRGYKCLKVISQNIGSREFVGILSIDFVILILSVLVLQHMWQTYLMAFNVLSRIHI